MIKKLFLIPLLALFCMVPFLSAQAASGVQISGVRVVTRNDANTPFVRTVVEVTDTVTPRLNIDSSGKYVTVTVPNAKIQKNVQKQYDADKNIVSRVWMTQRSSGTDINFKVPRAVTKKDIKVFTLPGAVRINQSASSSILMTNRVK